MNMDSTPTAAHTLDQTTVLEADAAQQAITAESRETNARRIAEISDGTDASHVAEHIRGLVAVTMAHLSVQASATTREHAEHWQQWALDVASRTERGVSVLV